MNETASGAAAARSGDWLWHNPLGAVQVIERIDRWGVQSLRVWSPASGVHQVEMATVQSIAAHVPTLNAIVHRAASARVHEALATEMVQSKGALSPQGLAQFKAKLTAAIETKLDSLQASLVSMVELRMTAALTAIGKKIGREAGQAAGQSQMLRHVLPPGEVAAPASDDERLLSSAAAYRVAADAGEALRRVLILRERPLHARDASSQPRPPPPPPPPARPSAVASPPPFELHFDESLADLSA